MQTTMVSMVIPCDLAHRARVVAAILGISRSEFMRRAVQGEVERVGRPLDDGTSDHHQADAAHQGGTAEVEQCQ